MSNVYADEGRVAPIRHPSWHRLQSVRLCPSPPSRSTIPRLPQFALQFDKHQKPPKRAKYSSWNDDVKQRSPRNPFPFTTIRKGTYAPPNHVAKFPRRPARKPAPVLAASLLHCLVPARVPPNSRTRSLLFNNLHTLFNSLSPRSLLLCCDCALFAKNPGGRGASHFPNPQSVHNPKGIYFFPKDRSQTL